MLVRASSASALNRPALTGLKLTHDAHVPRISGSIVGVGSASEMGPPRMAGPKQLTGPSADSPWKVTARRKYSQRLAPNRCRRSLRSQDIWRTHQVMKDADGCLIFSTKRGNIPGITDSAPDGLTIPVEPPTVESALQMVEELLALESEIIERLRAQEGK